MNSLHNCNLSFFWIAGTNQSQRTVICLKYDGKLPPWREATCSLKPAENSNRLNKLQTLHSAKPSAWDCSNEEWKLGIREEWKEHRLFDRQLSSTKEKIIPSLGFSWQRSQRSRREFFWCCSPSNGKSSHELQITMPRS